MKGALALPDQEALHAVLTFVLQVEVGLPAKYLEMEVEYFVLGVEHNVFALSLEDLSLEVEQLILEIKRRVQRTGVLPQVT